MVVLESQIRARFGDIVYTQKTHEKCADILLSRLHKLQMWKFVLSALTTGSLVGAIFANQVRWGTIVAGFASLALFVISNILKEEQLGEDASRHRATARMLWSVRESYLSLITDLYIGSVSRDDVQSKRDGLQEETGRIYSDALSTFAQGYEAARVALNVKGERSLSDDEINAFLPIPLQR